MRINRIEIYWNYPMNYVRIFRVKNIFIHERKKEGILCLIN